MSPLPPSRPAPSSRQHLAALPNALGELSSLSARRVRLDALMLLLVRSLVGLLPEGRKAHQEQLLQLAASGLLQPCAQAVAALLLEAGGAAGAPAVVQDVCQKALRWGCVCACVLCVWGRGRGMAGGTGMPRGGGRLGARGGGGHGTLVW